MTEPTVAPGDLQVTGGADGTSAVLADLGVLATRSDDLAGDLGKRSADCHLLLLDPDLLASAVLDPVGAATVAERLLSALDGPSGLTALSVRLSLRAAALRVAVTSYQTADDAAALAVDTVAYLEGATYFSVFEAVVAGREAIESGDPERWLTEHPDVVDDLLDSLPAMARLPLSLEAVAALVGTAAGDGRPVLLKWQEDPANTSVYDTSDVSMTEPPTGFSELVAGLTYRNTKSDADSDVIDVRVITQPDGTTAYIVDIPGTKNWGLGADNASPNDATTNLLALGGQTSSRQEAIAMALQTAGASATDPVMLVGHSQGGMVAAQAAADTADGTFGYNVTHVLTAGSPVSLADIPPGVQVLSLENEHDLVPHLDAEDNPDTVDHTTVTFDYQTGSIGENHAMDGGYQQAADALDDLEDPAVQAYRDSADAFFADPSGQTTLQTRAFEIDRIP